MAETINILITAEDKASQPMKGVGKAAGDMDSSVRKSGDGFTVMKGVAVNAVSAIASSFAAAGAAVAGFVKDSLGAAGSFEAGMNSFAAASGLAGAELDAFQQQFIELGQELPVSTTAVQDAATAMVKGGIDPAIVAAGALRDTLQFSLAAGFATLEEAANASAKLLGTWGDSTASAADQALFMAHAQELLTKSANASTLDADRLSEAMLMAAGSAKSAGVEYEEFVTIMGATSNGFNTAATQGTSFNNFFTRLIPQTKGAKAAMEELGLYTKETGSLFYDAQGQFIGMEAAAGLMQEAFAGLSDAQLSEAMATIFGNDAKNAALAIMEKGAVGYQAFAAEMAAANGIQAQSTATQRGLNFAMENMKGSVEALQITLGTRLLPILTPLITQFTGVLNATIGIASAFFDAGLGSSEFLESLGLLDAALGLAPGSIEGMYTSIVTLAAWVTGTAIPALQGFAGVVQTNIVPILAAAAGVILAVAVPAFIAWATAATAAAIATITALAPVVIPIVAIGAAAALLGVAWQQNWGNIQGVTAGVWATLQPILSELWTWLGTTIPPIIQQLSDFFTGTLLPAVTAFAGFVTESLLPALVNLFNLGLVVVAQEVGFLAGQLSTALQPAFEAVSSFITDNAMPAMEGMQPVMTKIGEIAGSVAGGFDGIAKAVAGVVKGFKSFIEHAAKIKVPSLVTPGSPTPLELGFRGIAASVAEAGAAINTAFPAMQALAGNLTAGVPAVAAGGSASQTTNTVGAINVYPDRGMDEDKLVRKVFDKFKQAVGGRK